MAYQYGHQGNKTIFDFRYDPVIDTEQLKKLGLSKSKIQAIMDAYAVKALTALTNSAKVSTQKLVPIDTHELQEQHIIETTPTLRDLSSEVYIDDKDHYGSRRKQPEEASSLADILNLNKYKRSKASGFTQFWIQGAHRDFKVKSKAILRGVK